MDNILSTYCAVQKSHPCLINVSLDINFMFNFIYMFDAYSKLSREIHVCPSSIYRYRIIGSSRKTRSCVIRTTVT